MVFKNQFRNNAVNQEASSVANSILTGTKLGSQFEELDITKQTSLTQAMKRKSNAQVLWETKQRKLAEFAAYEKKLKSSELSDYQRKDAEKKFADIQKLLAKMNVQDEKNKA